MAIDKDEIKRRVSIEQVLAYYGRQPDDRGVFQSSFLTTTTTGTSTTAERLAMDERFAIRKDALMEKGMDIFGLVGKMENLPTFPEQTAWIVKVFSLSHGTSAAERRIVQTYEYTDAAGNVVFQTVRYEPKDFRQRRPDGKGGWIWNLQEIQPVLYRLPEVMAADHIVIFEGEGT